MNKTALISNIGIIVAIGSIWGLTEFAFGLGPQKCATLMVGFILLWARFQSPAVAVCYLLIITLVRII